MSLNLPPLPQPSVYPGADLLSVVFQWSISYMISPDAANLGLKAIYIWAGLLVPTTVILYLYYPEVSSHVFRRRALTEASKTFGRTYEELDELYERRIPAWRFKSTKTRSDEAGRKNPTLQHYGH